MEQKRPRRSRTLIRSCEAAKILGVSREYVRQMVVSKVLPPKYLFNANSWRKIYIFDRKLIERFKDKDERKHIRWKEPVQSDWMTAIEISKTLKCSVDWIYHATKRGMLTPELIVSSNKQLFRLYDIDKVRVAMEKGDCEVRNTRRGHSNKTVKLMRRIKKLHGIGYNDSQIAIKTKSTQPFISKLRKEMGLSSNARRGHNKPNDLKV